MISFSQFLKNKNILESQIEDLKTLQIGMSILGNDLNQVVIWPREINEHENGGFFSKDNQLVFSRMGYINPNLQAIRSTLEKITYEFKVGTLKRLVIDDNNVRISKNLITGIKNFSWTYIDHVQKPYALWPPTNDWLNKLPSGLKVSFDHFKYGYIEKYFVLRQLDVEFTLDEKG